MRKILTAAGALIALFMMSTGAAAESVSTPNADTQGGSVQIESSDFQETVLLDDESCMITITGIDTDPSDGLTWQLHMVNKLEEQLHVGVSASALNRVMCGAGINLSAEALAEADGELIWTKESIEAAGVEGVDEVILLLSVSGNYDMSGSVDTWTKVYGKYVIEIGEGMDDQAFGAVFGSDFDNAVDYLCDKEDLKIALMSITEAEGLTGNRQILLNVLAENTSSADVVFGFDNIAVNDLMNQSEGLYSGECLVMAGCKNTWQTIYESEGINSAQDVTRLDFDWRLGEKSIATYHEEGGYTYGDRVYHTREIRVCYPQGEDKAVLYEHEPAEGDVVLADGSKGLKITVTETDMTTQANLGLAFATLFIENETDHVQEVALQSLQINGTDSIGMMSATIGPEQKCFKTITLPYAPAPSLDSVRFTFIFGEDITTGENENSITAAYAPATGEIIE